jgi:hypothetical protein
VPISATYDPTLARVRLAVTEIPDVAGAQVWVERSTDGIGWTAVRGAAPGIQAGGSFGVDDYEAPDGVLVTYRARTAAGFYALRDTFTRTVANSWGTADVGGAYAHGGAAANFDVAATFATYTGDSAVNTFESATVTGGSPTDVELYADLVCVSTPTGGSLYAELVARWASAAKAFARVTFTTAGNADVAIIANNGATVLASAVGHLTGVVGATVRARFRVVGTALKLKVWTGSTEPGPWTLEVTDTVAAAGGGVGMRFARGTGNTNVSPVIRVDNLSAVQYSSSPTATVTPALDGVWLKNAARPYLNRIVRVHQYSAITRPARGGVLDVIGRRDPVAVTDVRGSRRFDLILRADTADEVEALELALSFGDPVYLQPPAGSPVPGPLYAFVGDVTTDKGGEHQLELRFLTLPLTEVETPDPSIVGATITWGGVAAAYATWSAVTSAKATWLALLETISDPGDEVVG